MRNNIIKSVAVGLMLLALIPGAGIAAQNSSSVSAGVGMAASMPAIPNGYTVIPPNDSDRSDDQIVQLENLTIQSISSDKAKFPAVIYASRDIGGPCREYFDVQGRSGSKMHPCPLAPTVLYQITVKSDTILLFRNRSRATLNDFAVGDRVNVFGFMDRGTSGVEALILRNLDRPAVSQYVQLNNLTLVSGPTSSTPPASFRAARRGAEPCLSFSSDWAAVGIAAPCPLGVDISAGAEELKNAATAELYRPFHQYYNIQVTANTRLMNVNRRAISLGEFRSGDRVNIYGRYVPEKRMVEAMVVRNLSVPRGPEAAPSISSIRPTSGEIGTQVTLNGSFAASGNYIYLGDHNVSSAMRSDGKTMTFVIPEYVSPCAYDPYRWKEPPICIAVALELEPGEYPVYVVNAGGVSNRVTLEVER